MSYAENYNRAKELATQGMNKTSEGWMCTLLAKAITEEAPLTVIGVRSWWKVVGKDRDGEIWDAYRVEVTKHNIQDLRDRLITVYEYLDNGNLCEGPLYVSEDDSVIRLDTYLSTLLGVDEEGEYDE